MAPRRSREQREWQKEVWIDWLMALVDNPATPTGLKIYAASKALDLLEGPPPSRVMLPSGEFKTVWPRRRTRGLG